MEPKMNSVPEVSISGTPDKSVEAKGVSRKIQEYVRSRVAIGSLALASLALSACHKDYSDKGSFNSAFNQARKENQSKFIWHDKKYSTKLVDKELSDLYFESKSFLNTYYNSEYFKNKVITSDDSLSLEFKVGDLLYQKKDDADKEWREGEDIYNQDPSNKNLDIVRSLGGKLFQATVATGHIRETPEYKKTIDSVQRSEVGKRIKNLNEPKYFSITEQKGDKKDDGGFTIKDKSVFIYRNPKDKNDNTTPVHELTHKSTASNKDIGVFVWTGFREEAQKSLEKNKKVFFSKYPSENVDYFIDPTENDARQNSTRFWLHTNFPKYDVTKPFTREQYRFLKNRYSVLPYDIQQLMDIFSDEDVFVENMNKY